MNVCLPEFRHDFYKNQKNMEPAIEPCEYCGANFKTEKGVNNHSCKKKKLIEDHGGMAILRAFDMFEFWMRYNGMNLKSSRDINSFTKSPYLHVFLKLEARMETVPVPAKLYIQWLVNNDIKSPKWDSETILKKFITEHDKGDNVAGIVTQSLEHVALWCDNNEVDIEDYFSFVKAAEVILGLKNGKMSPWVLLLSCKASNFFDRINEGQMEAITDAMDLDYWQNRIETDEDAVKLVKFILNEVGH